MIWGGTWSSRALYVERWSEVVLQSPRSRKERMVMNEGMFARYAEKRQMDGQSRDGT